MTAAKLSRARSFEVVALLMAISCLNLLDRNLPFILTEVIRKDLHLSDTQIGMLGGIFFAGVYTVGGVPLGRLADRGFARPVLAASVAVWSLMTMAGGAAQNFSQLALARLGVAAGEAGATPPSHAIIAQNFPEERRATMLAVFQTGAPLGAMLGLMLGGWLLENFDWRTAFAFVGLPGLVLAALAYWRLPDTHRPEKIENESGLLRSALSLFTIPTFTLNALACACYAFAAYTGITWLPGFFQRVHGLSAGQTGLWLGLVTGVSGVIGMPVCGYLADRLSVRHPSWRLRVPAICMAISAPFVLAMLMVDDWRMALALYFIPQALTIAYLGPAFSAAHAVVPVHMRGLASSVLLGTLTLIGAGLGPPITGAISDALGAATDNLSLAKALLLMPVMLVLSSILFLWASRRLPGDIYRG